MRQAIGMLTAAPLTALRVIAPALAILILVSLFTLITAPYLIKMSAGALGPQSWPDSASFTLAIPIMVMFLLGYGGMAILWHRHTLSPAHPKPLGAGLIAGYILRVLILGAIQLAFLILLVSPLLMSAVFSETPGPAPSSIAKLMANFLTGMVLIWVSLRLSMVLPAAALGEKMGFVQSWRNTGALSSSLWGVAAMLTVINISVSLLADVIDAQTAIGAVMLLLPIYLVQGLLIFSVLTVIYRTLILDENFSI